KIGELDKLDPIFRPCRRAVSHREPHHPSGPPAVRGEGAVAGHDRASGSRSRTHPSGRPAFIGTVGGPRPHHPSRSPPTPPGIEPGADDAVIRDKFARVVAHESAGPVLARV